MQTDVIRLLPDSVANQIAAGEVIQRPASVVKELVENAIDAGADRIQIVIRDAGRTLIQVVDNGCGMSAADARMAFERHATSKITEAVDLFALRTMGFRGEALPSIAAVAQIDMRTMRADENIGTRVQISESRFESQEPCACVPGTNLMVKNLFFHMPARRKFLKKDSVELSHILHEFERLALVNTGVDFTIVHNDVTLHQLLRGSLKQRICALFGKNLDTRLAPVETETTVARISGFVTLPQYAAKRGAHQFFFVNGRNMRHPYFHKAVMTCFENLIPSDSQPGYFINFEVDPASIDVNIHPQKHEIKFENEQMIWQVLVAAVREALGRVNAVSGIDFDRDDAPEMPAFDLRQPVCFPTEEVDINYNPFVPDSGAKPAPHVDARDGARRSNLNNWDKLYQDFERARDDSYRDFRASSINPAADTPQQPQDALPGIETANGATCLQLRNRYIVTSSPEGMMVIDRHRAHVRVLYDSYEKMTATERLSSQQLIFPETITLTAAQSAILDNILPQLAESGFELSYLGDLTWAVNGLPSVVASANPQELLADILDSEATETDTAADALRRHINLSLARSAAIRAGSAMPQAEAENLVARLFASPQPNYTPDGLSTFAVLPLDRIATMLG